MITFVWAEDLNGVIGKDGKLPWHLPNELKYFKEVTLTGDVVMGRKTLESIPNPPLKNRVNYVLTTNKEFDAPGVIVCHSKEEILEKTKESSKPIHIIGGISLFEMFKDDVDMLYRTLIHEKFEGDTFIPEIDYTEFILMEERDGVVDEKNRHPHSFQIFKRK